MRRDLIIVWIVVAFLWLFVIPLGIIESQPVRIAPPGCHYRIEGDLRCGGLQP